MADQLGTMWKEDGLRLLATLCFSSLRSICAQLHGPLSEQPVLEVLAAIQGHFYSGCVYMVYSGGQRDENTAVKRFRLLSTRGVPTATLHVQTLVDTLGNLTCRRNRPLYVLPGYDDITIASLKQVSQETSLSSGRWLLFLHHDNGPLVDLFRDLYVPFDCEFLVAQWSNTSDNVNLTEVYRTGPSSTVYTEHWGFWSNSGGLRARREGLYRRRNNLQGVTIRAAARDYASMIKVRMVNGRLTVTGGYTGHIWETLQKMLNFTMEYIDTASGGWPETLVNGSWRGFFGLVASNEVEVSAKSALFQEKRTWIGDFSQPIYVTRMQVYIHIPRSKHGGWEGVSGPFSAALWLVLLVTIPIVGFSLALMHHANMCYGSPVNHTSSSVKLSRSNTEVNDHPGQDAATNVYNKCTVGEYNERVLCNAKPHQLDCRMDHEYVSKERAESRHNDQPHVALHGFLYDVFAIFSAQGVNTPGSSQQSRASMWILHATAIVVTTAYCCNVMASLAFERMELPFTTFQEMLDDGTYRLGILDGDTLYKQFKNAKDPVLKEVFRKLLEPAAGSHPKSEVEGLQRVCREDRYAFFAPDMVARDVGEKVSCDLIPVRGASYTASLGILFRKKSPYRNIITMGLERLRRTGIQSIIEQRTFPTQRFPEEKLLTAVDMDSVSGFYYILAAGVLASVLVLLVESIYWRRCRRP